MAQSREHGSQSLEMLRLRALAEQESEMVLELSPAGRFSYVSPSVELLLGYTPEEFAAFDPLECVHPDDVASVEADYNALRVEGSRVHSLHRAQHKKGHWCWLEDLACSFIDDQGERRILILARDVSHQKRLEEELERQLAVQGRVADLSRHFLSLASDAIDEGVERHLATIAELACADAVRLVVRKRGSAGPGETYDYRAPLHAGGEPGWPGDFAQRFPWLGGRLADGEVVQLHSVDELPEVARRERHEFRRRGVRSALLIPLWFGRTVIGYQIFETLRDSHHWSLRDVAQLRLVGEIFASAVQRKHAEEFLRASQERFHAIAEHAGELVMEMDERGCLHFLSPSVEQQLGYRANELQGTSAYALMHEDELPSLRPVFEETLEGESELRVMHRMKHKNGSWRWFESSGRVYFSGAGERRFISIGRDVTDRRAAEREIERQLSVEKRVAALSRRFLSLKPEQTDAATEEALRESAALAGAARSFLFVQTPNPSEPQWYEWVREGITSFQDSTPQPWSTGMLRDGQVVQIFAGDSVPEEAEPERLLMRARGSRSLLVIPLLSQQGPIGMIGFESHDEERRWSEADVTLLRLIGEILISAVQRTRTELALRESQSHLLHAERLQAVGRLAGGIAHDFNNLLTVILGFSRPLMEDLAEGDPVREDIVEIHGAAERAAALTRQLLTFSRRQKVDEQMVNWNTVLRGLESLLARLLGDDVELVLELGSDIGDVRGDPHQFEQVVVNLAANARDAMPDGGTLHIISRALRVNAEEALRIGVSGVGSYVLLEVRDQGHGLDEETRAQIFDPFFTTKDPGKGTGLGLSITYGVVEQAGGAIQVESELNKGTVFRIWIPCERASLERSESGESIALERGSGCVLVVDDDSSGRRLARRALEGEGYRVLEASNGEEALALATQQQAPVDGLVTDVVMPRMGGYELASRLRALHPRLAVVFVSGYPEGDEATHREGLEPGLAILMKPFTGTTLLIALREALERSTASD